MKTKKFIRSFIAFSSLYLFLLIVGRENIAWWFKPLLIPFLLYIVSVSDPFRNQKTLLFALFFSWVGDVLLMFANQHALFFILGLISFLIAHLAYIILFQRQNKINENNNYLWFIPFVIIYLVTILRILWPFLNEMKIPVLVYAIVISLMLLMSIKAYFQWEKPSNLWVLIGAILFVISDSILAINKFHSPVLMSSFWIMSTYLGAQFCIVNAILQKQKKLSFN